MTAHEYIKSKGLEYRMQSDEIVLKVCPFCKDSKSHFYMNPGEGAYFCHKCQEKGNLITLQKHMGDFEKQKHSLGSSRTMAGKPQGGVSKAFPDEDRQRVTLDLSRAIKANSALLSDEKALTYVTESRGISQVALEHFKLGLEVDQKGNRWLTLPHLVKGKLVNIKSRSLPPAEKTFRRIAGYPSVLFNADALEETDEIFIAEGEMDAVTLWDQGIKNVVGSTTGAGSFDPSWVDQLMKVTKIILVYDPDEAGQKGAREVARRLGYDRCFNVVLPNGLDVNEYFKAGNDIFEFRTMVSQARKFDIAGILTIQEGLKNFRTEVSKSNQLEGIQTGYHSIDKIISSGFQSGDLVILSAPPKTGKTSFALQIALYNAVQDVPSLFFCLEMGPMRIIRKIVQNHAGIATIKPAEIEAAQARFKGKPLYLGYRYQKPDVDDTIKTLQEAIRRYGLKLVIFDHLHFLCRSVNNQVQEVGLAVQAFKFLAEEMEIPVVLIAQPRKIQPDCIMTAQDLKDSSSIFSDCDHLIILHRHRMASTGENYKDQKPHGQAYDPVTLVRIEASRYGPGGETLLYFHGECSRFEEMSQFGNRT